MGDGVQITFRGDISDVVKKAQQIPGEVDRATRKGRKSWEGGGTEPGTRDQYRKMAGMGAEIERQDEARKKKEQDQANKDYLRRLKWNSRIQEDQDRAAQKEADRAAKASDWAEQFGKALESRLMGAIGPAAMAMKVIELGWGHVINQVKTLLNIQETKLESGIETKSTRGLQIFSGVGTATDAEVTAMASRAQANVNAIATGGPGANAYGLSYFGMTDFKRYREEGLNMVELIGAMAKTYKQAGGTPQYAAAAESILGSDWIKLRGLIAAEAHKEKLPSFLFGGQKTVMEAIESKKGGEMAQRALADAFQKNVMARLTPGELMGGTMGGPAQLLSNVTSLQAMGGGDILSAIARGPQERIAAATEATAANTAKMAGGVQSQDWGFTPPAPSNYVLRRH